MWSLQQCVQRYVCCHGFIVAKKIRNSEGKLGNGHLLFTLTPMNKKQAKNRLLLLVLLGQNIHLWYCSSIIIFNVAWQWRLQSAANGWIMFRNDPDLASASLPWPWTECQQAESGGNVIQIQKAMRHWNVFIHIHYECVSSLYLDVKIQLASKVQQWLWFLFKHWLWDSAALS